MSAKKHPNERKKKRCVTISKIRKKLVKKRTKKYVSRSKKSLKCSSNSQNNSKQSKPKEDRKITVQQLKIGCKRYQEFHDNFLTYDKIIQFLEKICKDNPETIEVILIGKSGEGKPIYMAQLGDQNSATSPKMATFIEAGAKGEDVYAVSNAVFMIDYLTKNPNKTKLMDYLIVPCTNPDAYDKHIKSKEDKNKKQTCNIKRSNSKTNCCHVEKKQPTQSPDNKSQTSKCTDSFVKETSDNVCSVCGLHRTHLLRNAVKKKPNAKIQKKKTKPDNKCKKSPSKKNSKCDNKKNNIKNDNKTTVQKPTSKIDDKTNFRNDLSCNFPVILGLNDMRNIPTNIFLEKISIWKENYLNTSPETRALLTVISHFQFAIKMIISLQEGGESICYPYGFCAGATEEINDLKEVAKKGKSAICGRDFEFGSAYHIKGLTYGNLIDFLKVDKAAIKYTYIIQVHKKTSTYNEKEEQKRLMTYGCQVIAGITRMTSAVYKSFCRVNDKNHETSTIKNPLEKKSTF